MEETARFTDAIKELLDGGREERLADLLAEAHPADVSHAIRELPVDDAVRVVRVLARQHAGEVLAELDDPVLRELVGSLDEAEVSRALDSMPPEEVADVVEELPKERAEGLLDLMAEEKAEEVQELLEYREGTAGRLMSPDFVAVNEQATVAKAIEHIRRAKTGEGAFYLYVVDDHDHLVGFVPLHRLIATDPATPIRAIRTEGVESVTVDTDQEEVARLVQRYNLIQVPVVDVNRRPLGPIRVADVIAVIAYAWKGQALLALILGFALVFNMLVAAVVGTLIPIALKAFRIDPAIASSVIITTFTDVCGFFSFLGLATLLIKFLL